MIDPISIPKLSYWFIQHSLNQNHAITPTKLLYYLIQTHLWSIYHHNTSLVTESLETWANGPMFATHYHEYKDKWNEMIEFPSRRQPEWLAEEEEQKFLEKIWSQYKRFTDRQIVRILSNEQSFWSEWNYAANPRLKSAIDDTFLHQYMKKQFVS